ncbi:hypothetical protein JWG45_07340 [Leptospira sp. 201903070]|uniref:Phage tail protein n=1 Tax=Leptospira ainlahdjerensis TaxID=2810033 RepID=A0ABS2UDG7_9LEPT|nr:hypothetical protein [Leptospira ainlahdjerensis]MBM9576965.1 hypothetical protein [Leptospira ainlahdjerensis]
MAVFNSSKTRTWTRNTPADGDLFDDEVDRQYENLQYLKDRIDVAETNFINLILPLGSIIEDSLNLAPVAYFKEANAQGISRTTFSALWNSVRRNVLGIIPATDRLSVNSHGCEEGQLIKFSFTGGGVTALTNYYVRNPSENDFQISSTPTGSILDLTSSQTGEMLVNVEYGFGDGATTYNVPDRRGLFSRGAGIHGTRSKAAGGNYDGGSVGFAGQDQVQGHGHELWGENGSAAGSSTVHFNSLAANVSNLFSGGGPTGQPVRNLNTDGVNGAPRIGTETTPVFVAVRYKVRVI